MGARTELHQDQRNLALQRILKKALLHLTNPLLRRTKAQLIPSKNLLLQDLLSPPLLGNQVIKVVLVETNLLDQLVHLTNLRLLHLHFDQEHLNHLKKEVLQHIKEIILVVLLDHAHRLHLEVANRRGNEELVLDQILLGQAVKETTEEEVILLDQRVEAEEFKKLLILRSL